MRGPGMRTAVLLVAVLTACSTDGPESSQEAEVTTMQLTSDSFDDGDSIPSQYTCDGADVSPPLAWSDVPDGTASFALIVDDPDARGFVHWVLTDIPGDARELPEGEGDSIGMPGPNDFGRTGWADHARRASIATPSRCTPSPNRSLARPRPMPSGPPRRFQRWPARR